MNTPWEAQAEPLDRIAAALESIAESLKGRLALEERDELRRAGCGLLRLGAKYTSEEPERRPLRVVR